MVAVGKARTVDDAADLAVETDIVQMVLGSLGLARILLRGVMHVGDAGTAEQRVVVERHLCVERKHAVVLDHDQRIDLGGISSVTADDFIL